MTDACYPYGIMGLEWRILKSVVQAVGARNPLDIPRLAEWRIAHIIWKRGVKGMDIVIHHSVVAAVDVGHIRMGSVVVSCPPEAPPEGFQAMYCKVESNTVRHEFKRHGHMAWSCW